MDDDCPPAAGVDNNIEAAAAADCVCLRVYGVAFLALLLGGSN